MQDHLARKDFWNEVILFTNKDENLTKAHVRYLEPRSYESANTIGRYAVMNGNTPQLALLPRGDRDAVESFLEQIRLLLGVLGHRVLEPLAPVAPAPATSVKPSVEAPAVQSGRAGASPGTALKLSAKSITARAVLSDEGIVVLAGSHAAANLADSISTTSRKLREQLISDAVLVLDGEALKFSEDYRFTSPSAAACVVVGYAVNGRAAWKTEGGQSISDLEDSVAAPSA